MALVPSHYHVDVVLYQNLGKKWRWRADSLIGTPGNTCSQDISHIILSHTPHMMALYRNPCIYGNINHLTTVYQMNAQFEGGGGWWICTNISPAWSVHQYVTCKVTLSVVWLQSVGYAGHSNTRSIHQTESHHLYMYVS